MIDAAQVEPPNQGAGGIETRPMAGVCVYRRRGGRVTYRLNSDASEAADAAKALWCDVVRTPSLRPSSCNDFRWAGQLLLAGVLAEGIWRPAHLRVWAESLIDALPIQDGLWTEWQIDGQRDARVLSAWTRTLLAKWPGPVSWATEWEAFVSTLDLRLDGLRRRRRVNRLSGLEWLALGSAQHAIGIPGALFAHLAGIHHLTAMTLNCVARIATGRSIAHARPSNPQHSDQVDEHNAILASAHAALGLPARGGSSPIWLGEALRALPAASPESAGLRSIAVSSVRQILATHHARDRRAGLLLGWLSHMLTMGTVSRERAALSTIRGYFRQVTRLVFDSEDGLDVLLQDDLRQIEDMYQRWQEQSEWNGDVCAGLASLDGFLADICGRPTVRVHRDSTRRGASLGGPDSRVLSETELERISKRLDDRAGGRASLMAGVLFLLGAALPLRPQEAVRIRVGQVRDVGGSTYIDVRHDRRRGRLKTQMSVRTLSIDDPRAADTVRRWRDSRLREGAPADAPLFGDALDVHDTQDLAAAQIRIQQAMREVTGEAGIRVYALRHTCITRLVLAALRPASHFPFDPLLEVAARAGHAGPATTVLHYFHAHPLAVRRCLDGPLGAILSVRVAASWACMDENTLGKRIVRHPGQRTRILLQAMTQSVADEQFAAWEDTHLLVAKDASPVRVPITLPTRVPVVEPRTVFDLWCAEAVGRNGEILAAAVGLTNDQWARQRELRAELGAVVPAQIRASWWRLGKLRPVTRALQQPSDPDSLRRAVRSWRACQGTRYLDASDTNRIDALLWWLFAAGLRSTQIVLRATNADQTAISRVNDQIVSIFRAPPSIERLRQRAGAGRPPLHLAIAEHLPPQGRPFGEAAVSMTGFRALMCAAWMSLELNRLCETRTE